MVTGANCREHRFSPKSCFPRREVGHVPRVLQAAGEHHARLPRLPDADQHDSGDMFGILFQESKTNYNSTTSAYATASERGQARCRAADSRLPRAAGHVADIPEGARRECVARAGDSKLGGELSVKVVEAEMMIMPFPT